MKARKTNPWKLSKAETDFLAALIEDGQVKVAARRLGISHRTAEHHLLNVRRQMEVNRTLLAVLKWDRFVRGVAP